MGSKRPSNNCLVHFYKRNLKESLKMPQSKKDLKTLQKKKNIAAGIGDAQGRVASNNKDAVVMASCSICKQSIRMIKKNEQAKIHVESKHSGKQFSDCFPGFTCS